MHKYASAEVLSAELAGSTQSVVRRTAHRAVFAYVPREGYLYVRSRAISSRTNDNFDEFPAAEIKKAYKTFVGRPVFVNHHNDDHRRARGVIIDAALHEDINPDGSPDTWTEVLMEVDAVRFPVLAKAILAGHIDRTSMGTDVKYSVCTACGNRAETPLDYCQHIPRMKGQYVYRTTASGEKEGTLVAERCYGLNFFENSLLVEDPADPTAFFLGVEAGPGVPSMGVKASIEREGAGVPARPQYNVGNAKLLALHLVHVHGDDRSVPDLVKHVKVNALQEQHAAKHRDNDDHDHSHPMTKTVAAGGTHRLVHVRLPADDHETAHRVLREAYERHVRKKTEGSDLSSDLVSRMSTDGGFSVHPDSGAEPQDGYMCSIGVGKKFGSMGELTPEAMKSFMESNKQALGQPDTYLGGWLDTHTGEAWLDISKRHPDVDSSMVSAKQLGEEAVYDIKNGKSIYTNTYGKAAVLVIQSAGPKYLNPGDHPFFQQIPISAANIVNTYYQGTAADRAAGDTWYHGAHLVAKAIGQGDAQKGAGLLAVYSPNTPWPTNMFNAAHAMEQGKGIGGKGSGFFASAAQKAMADRVIGGANHEDVLKGSKIRSFAHLIANDGDADPSNPRVVIDRHAMSVAAGRRLTDDEIAKAPISTPHYYDHVVKAYVDAANEISERELSPIEPHQVQATTWLVQQRNNSEADAAHVGRLERGRTTRNENANAQWQDYAQERYPQLTGPGWHQAMFAEALGEQTAPAEVDTLRDEACPVCGEDDSFNGAECVVCGYIAPPKQFRDPDPAVAQNNDLREDKQDALEGADLPTGGGKATIIVKTKNGTPGTTTPDSKTPQNSRPITSSRRPVVRIHGKNRQKELEYA